MITHYGTVAVIFQGLESQCEESVGLEKNKMNGCHEIRFQIQHTVFCIDISMVQLDPWQMLYYCFCFCTILLRK